IVVRALMPTSLPTVRDTTRSALVTPWTSSSVAESNAALTGTIASPTPSPPSASGTVATGSRSESTPHWDIHAKLTQDAAIPTAVTTPAGRRCANQPPANAPTGRPTRNLM